MQVYLKGVEEKEGKQWMHEAAKVAQNALCTKAKCGSIIVKDGQLIGSGYNAPPQDSEGARMCNADRSFGEPKYDKTCCMHAEWRAILNALQKHPSELSGATLYFTRVNTKGGVVRSGKPYCTVCSRLALDVGISKFTLWHEEGICEYSTDEYNTLSYTYDPEQ